jgi:hypothetical protein
MVTKRWAGPPQRQEWETPMAAEAPKVAAQTVPNVDNGDEK